MHQSAYVHFWQWFESEAGALRNALKQRENMERDFVDKLAPQLARVSEDIYFLAGLPQQHTAD